MLILAAGFVMGPDSALAKEKKAGKGKKKKAQVEEKQVISVGESKTISGTIKVDGDVVKLVCDGGIEYLLSGSTAEANKDKTSQKVTIVGTVTEIEGKKWLAADPVVDKAREKPAAGNTGK